MKSVDWMRYLGLAATAVYLLGVGSYFWNVPSEKYLWRLDPNNFGDTLAGIAGPLAFIWLVLGFFIQSEQLKAQGASVDAQREALEMQRTELELQRNELKLQREETSRLADEAAKQAAAVALNEAHARRDTFLRTFDLVSPMQISLAIRIARLLEPTAVYSALQSHSQGETSAAYDLVVANLKGRPGAFSQYGIDTANLSFLSMQFIENFEFIADSAEKADQLANMLRVIEKSDMSRAYVALCISMKRTANFRTRESPTNFDQNGI
jgi:hypothetical protein